MGIVLVLVLVPCSCSCLVGLFCFGGERRKEEGGMKFCGGGGMVWCGMEAKESKM